MDKKRVLEAVVAKLHADLQVMVDSAHAAHAAATDEDNQAENKYDTRALEASYLAGAQSKRAAEIKSVLTECQGMVPTPLEPGTAARAGALVELESLGKRSLHFLVIRQGGYSVQMEGREVHVMSVTSPLGEEIIGRKAGESFEVVLGSQRRRSYQIVSVS